MGSHLSILPLDRPSSRVEVETERILFSSFCPHPRLISSIDRTTPRRHCSEAFESTIHDQSNATYIREWICVSAANIEFPCFLSRFHLCWLRFQDRPKVHSNHILQEATTFVTCTHDMSTEGQGEYDDSNMGKKDLYFLCIYVVLFFDLRFLISSPTLCRPTFPPFLLSSLSRFEQEESSCRCRC